MAEQQTTEVKVLKDELQTDKKTLCVCLYGGPGTGKSVQQALIFARLKMWGVDAIMSMEAAKLHVYSGSKEILTQEGLYGDQLKELNLFNGKVDVIVTEAPLLFNIIYDRTYNNKFDIDWHRSVANTYNKFDNFTVMYNRAHDYQQEGRYQDEAAAKEVDKIMRNVLKEYGSIDIETEPFEENAIMVARQVMKRLGRKPPM